MDPRQMAHKWTAEVLGGRAGHFTGRPQKGDGGVR